MGLDKCAVCGDYKFTSSHRCLPVFQVVRRDDWAQWKDKREMNELTREEYEEIEWQRIRASDGKEAAEKYVVDLSHHFCEQLHDQAVYVRDSAGKVTKHTVATEMVLEAYSEDQEDIQIPDELYDDAEEAEGFDS